MTKGDKILIISIVLISLISLAYTNTYISSADEKYVSIQVNGQEIKKFFYDKKIIGQTIPIQTEYGYNLLEIGDQRVRVIEADCPDKIDVKQGYISKVGETIICLPNRLVIEIKGSKDGKEEIDIISY